MQIILTEGDKSVVLLDTEFREDIDAVVNKCRTLAAARIPRGSTRPRMAVEVIGVSPEATLPATVGQRFPNMTQASFALGLGYNGVGMAFTKSGSDTAVLRGVTFKKVV